MSDELQAERQLSAETERENRCLREAVERLRDALGKANSDAEDAEDRAYRADQSSKHFERLWLAANNELEAAKTLATQAETALLELKRLCSEQNIRSDVQSYLDFPDRVLSAIEDAK